MVDEMPKRSALLVAAMSLANAGDNRPTDLGAASTYRALR